MPVEHSDPEEILGAWIRPNAEAMSGHLVVRMDANIEATWLITACGIRFAAAPAEFCESSEHEGLGKAAYLRCIDCLSNQAHYQRPKTGE
ncbi:MAG: hypothetical protein HUU38_08960 [Anaerolineales bacterium]|nr:hypothetical protein [Anaerolineales bacterium]